MKGSFDVFMCGLAPIPAAAALSNRYDLACQSDSRSNSKIKI